MIYTRLLSHRNITKYGLYLACRYLMRNRPPWAVTYQITDKCNLKCSFCNYHTSETDYLKLNTFANMDFDLFKRSLDEIKGYPMVILTGGEPTLHPRFDEIMDEVYKRHFLVFVVTNGTTLDHASWIDQADFISVSLDGVGKDHDDVRGLPGTFDTVVNGLKRATSMKKRPLMFVNSVMATNTYTHIGELVDYLNENVPIDAMNINQLWFKTEKQVEAHNHLCYFPIKNTGSIDTDMDIEGLGAALVEIRKKKTKFHINFFPDIAGSEITDYYTTGKNGKKRARCFWHYCRIKSNGDMYVCDEYVIGNLKNDTLMDIWMSEEYIRLRAALKKEKSFPICTRCCDFYKM